MRWVQVARAPGSRELREREDHAVRSRRLGGRHDAAWPRPVLGQSGRAGRLRVDRGAWSRPGLGSHVDRARWRHRLDLRRLHRADVPSRATAPAAGGRNGSPRIRRLGPEPGAIEAEGAQAAALGEVRRMIGLRTRLLRPGLLRAAVVVMLVPALVVGGYALFAATRPAPIRIGAVFPISGNVAALAGPELKGVQIAVDLVNADGGIDGRPNELEVRDLRSRSESDGVMRELKDQGIEIVIGAYSSDLSIAASEAADRAGLLYWEAGAVADRLTGRGLPMVFRVGTNGRTLGANSASFAAEELAGRLGKPVSELRVAIAVAEDDYARTVADAAEATAIDLGMPVVTRASYNLYLPDWPAVMADLKAARPDVIILASHIPDGIAFRQAMLASGLRVGALIGSTMAECDPDFAGELGPDAIGIFASDRPTAGFKPSALDTEAAAAYARFAPAWQAAAREAGGEGDAPGDPDDEGYGDRYGDRYGESSYAIFGPDQDATAEESE